MKSQECRFYGTIFGTPICTVVRDIINVMVEVLLWECTLVGLYLHGGYEDGVEVIGRPGDRHYKEVSLPTANVGAELPFWWSWRCVTLTYGSAVVEIGLIKWG